MRKEDLIPGSLRLVMLGLAGIGSALAGNGCSVLLDFEQCLADSDCSDFGGGYVCVSNSCIPDGFAGDGDGDTSGDGDGDTSGDGDGDTTGDGDGDTSGDGDGDTTGDGDGDTTNGDGDGEGSGDGDGEGSGDGDGEGSGDGDGDMSGDGDGEGLMPVDMIDDFEDGNGALLPEDGRQGFWYIFNDGSMGSSQMPPSDMVLPSDGGANNTNYAMHTSGSGFTVWGAGLGIDFKNMGGNNPIKLPYDASSYSGIVLMAKGNGSIRLSVPIEATVPVSEGGTCESECDAHGILLEFEDDWQSFEVPFEQLAQEGWGTPADWDASTTAGVLFRVNQNVDFEFWIDEIGFY